MRIMVDVTHPAHVHFFRPAISIWQETGHKVELVAREKDVTLALLDHYGYEYEVLSKSRSGLVGLGLELLEHEGRLLKLILLNRPDVILEIGGTFIVHAAAVTRTPALVFSDTEHAKASNMITFPFATKIFTPQCFQGDLGQKHVRYRGYHELAYLHPDYYQPNPSIRVELGLDEGERYSVVRFVSWDASHDRGHAGMSLAFKRELVALLAAHGRVMISSEAPLPAEFDTYRLAVPPHRMHDLLAFAQLYVGEGATMASEAAILGTPAIYVNSLSAGTLEEIRDYGLLVMSTNRDEILSDARRLLSDGSAKQKLKVNRDNMLNEKEDVAAFVCRQVREFGKNRNRAGEADPTEIL